jgi:hypothetical protein
MSKAAELAALIGSQTALSKPRMSKAAELAALIGSQTALSNRNLIINGAMQVAQRGTSFASVSTAYTLDRFQAQNSSLGAFTVTQSSTAPDGFAKSLKWDCTTADASPAAGDFAGLNYRIEGQDLQQLKKGTSGALSTTVSFWVRSNKTGTYILEIVDADNSRNIHKAYTISSADTWEHKELTFAGDTTGTLTNDNNLSMYLRWYLGAGSTYTSGTLATDWQANVNADRAVGQVNLADSTSNEWYITGIQFEVGTNASDFEHRSFGEELALCQRYYEKSYDYGTAIGTATYAGTISMGGGTTGSTTSFSPMLVGVFKVRKRAAPTVTVYDQAGTSGKVQRWQLGLTNSNGHTATVADNSETNFKVYSGNGDNASGIQCHYEATAEL